MIGDVQGQNKTLTKVQGWIERNEMIYKERQVRTLGKG